uniref:SFRICE_014455 n=1 Tax=Spodoptera frugiperda TaxID=7108 RepID=A0A2H1V3F3_SPOFR
MEKNEQETLTLHSDSRLLGLRGHFLHKIFLHMSGLLYSVLDQGVGDRSFNCSGLSESDTARSPSNVLFLSRLEKFFKRGKSSNFFSRLGGARLRDGCYLATMDAALYLIPAWFYGHSILLIAPASEPRRPGLDKQGLKK